MKILELFAGSRSIGKAAEELGHEVFSTDIHPFEGIDLVKDVLEINTDDIPFVPDVIWASPPCTGFSVAAIGHHWTGGKGAYIPKTDTARLGIKLVEKTFEIINFYYDMNNCMEWFVENPRGVLRKIPIMERYQRHTVTYCQYGDERMKPTDIWTNSVEWTPKPMCKNGAPCHVAAPRGSRTGTQGLKGNYERSKIPHELCLEVVKAAEIGHLLPF
jgi:hypothetical protein